MSTHLPMRCIPALTLLLALAGGPASGQSFPVTPAQSATAQQVAQAGVPLSELAPDAPEQYTVKPGDTLWAIATLYLRSPWRWPELWGMNLRDIPNPHLIYPGHLLRLEKSGGRATLRSGAAGTPAAGSATEGAALPLVRLSPRVRQEALPAPLSTLQSRAIEPFLTESQILESDELAQAARIVATQETRVLLTRGDRAYARGFADTQVRQFRVFRPATALRDPISGETLGYEIQLVGRAVLAQGESLREVELADGKQRSEVVPATIDIVAAREEMRVGDRLLPEPPRSFLNYAPRAPEQAIEGRIVAVHGSAVVNAAQNQVVVINRGQRDGLQSGHVLAILKDGVRLADKTDAARTMLKLPDERNGLLMVFRTFERLSYALVLDITDGVKIGDRLATPR